MMLLVRNKVQDTAKWKRVFDAQKDLVCAAGLKLVHTWRSVDEPDQVFFLMEVPDRSAAEAYMSSPEATAVGTEAGVMDGEFHFLEALTE